MALDLLILTPNAAHPLLPTTHSLCTTLCKSYKNGRLPPYTPLRAPFPLFSSNIILEDGLSPHSTTPVVFL